MMQMNDNTARMVETLVRETIERLTHTQMTAGSCLVLVPAYLADLPVVQNYLDQTAAGFELTVVHNEMCGLSVFPHAAKSIGIHDTAQTGMVASNLCSFDHIVCLQPPLSLLEKVLSGNDSDFFSYILIQAALRGVRVSISTGFGQPQAKRGVFFEKVSALISGMTDMGFIINFREDLSARSEKSRSGNSLITEEDVITEYNRGGRIIKTDSQTIVTPLARDKIRELGLCIEQA